MKKRVFNPTVIFSIFILLLSWGCKRNITPDAEVKPESQLVRKGPKTNPFSLRNIMRAQDTVAARSGKSGRAALQAVSSYPSYVYFRLDPSKMAAGQFKSIEADTNCMLLDIPFGDAAVYNNETLDEAGAEQLRDGFLYGMVPATDTLLNRLQGMSNLGFTRLDTIVLPPDSSVTLQQVAMQQAGFEVNLLDLCLFKRPHGQIRYSYTENGVVKEDPVRGIKVWALVFGIPLHSYTDANGFYEINYRFSIGTVMGTEAKNSRVNIRAVETNGTAVGAIARTLLQLVTGPKSVYGWVTPCKMRDGQDIVYKNHTQKRLWCQILNGVYFSDQYYRQEGINPPSNLVFYAQWAGQSGSASAPMLGHISAANTVTERILNDLFGLNVNIKSSFPNLYNIFSDLLPDVIIPVSSVAEPSNFNMSETRTIFHELGHAAFMLQVGSGWYSTLEAMTIENRNNEVVGNPYGDGSKQGTYHYISMAESWAEFIGQNFLARRYPDVQIRRTNPNNYTTDYPSNLLEYEGYYYEFKWMPYGLFHDLMDKFNPDPLEKFDIASGVTIKQMYTAFQPNTTRWCDYFSSFTSRYNVPGAWSIFDYYLAPCPGTRYGNVAINETFTKNNCTAPGIGSSVQVSVPLNQFYSRVSVADANALARAYAQEVANQQGICLCTSCTGNSRKCINGVCETGSKVYYESVPLRDGTFACYYHWVFSDGSTQTGGMDKKSVPCLD